MLSNYFNEIVGSLTSVSIPLLLLPNNSTPSIYFYSSVSLILLYFSLQMKSSSQRLYYHTTPPFFFCANSHKACDFMLCIPRPTITHFPVFQCHSYFSDCSKFVFLSPIPFTGFYHSGQHLQRLFIVYVNTNSLCPSFHIIHSNLPFHLPH